jgi:protein-S-isoprenylcysteine O-methyltransferase Ste14
MRVFLWVVRALAYGLSLGFFGALAVSSYQSFQASRSALAFALLAVNALFLWLFLCRCKASAVAGSPLAWLLGLGCTLLPMLPRPSGPVLWGGLGPALQLLGAALAVAALLSLGRSFGVVAAHRGIRTGGLYRWVRHPLYAAELLFLLGFTLAHASAWNAGVWLLAAGLQVCRAAFEERLLARDPGYRAYRLRCPFRFVPGLW